ncbi:DUF1653 domain-containing protein [Thermus thermophilus]|uniref:DUF1653 domain-containing protein n=1 Tax=Thermus thermophilus TaxID=274 RepID=UPI002D21E33F|nr:DUF1653 domain-containing protein [Thermus thermophilus]
MRLLPHVGRRLPAGQEAETPAGGGPLPATGGAPPCRLSPGCAAPTKGGPYRVLFLVRPSETGEPLAVYGERGLWARPLSLWLAKAVVEGREVPRFHPLEELPGPGVD